MLSMFLLVTNGLCHRLERIVARCIWVSIWNQISSRENVDVFEHFTGTNLDLNLILTFYIKIRITSVTTLDNNQKR